MDQDIFLNALSAADVKSAYESNADTNAFTDALKTKLETTDVFDDAGTYANLRAQATTASDIGLGSVENYSIATKEEAEAGAVNNKYMTPERTTEAISFQTSGLLTSGDIITATKEEAETGTDNNVLMTPLRTKEAIDVFASAVVISTTAPTNPKEGDL
jgi:hypothetical protein